MGDHPLSLPHGNKAEAAGASPQFLVIGHVTRDLVPDGSYRVGGTATYSALTAARLGYRVGVLTAAAPDHPLFDAALGIRVCCCPSPTSTTFENIYSGHGRRQYLRAVAERLTVAQLPPEWQQAPIVHLGPVAQEVDASLAPVFPDGLLGVTPQGWMRRWDETGLVAPVSWKDADDILPLADVVVLSQEDLGGDQAALADLVRRARLLVLTVGSKGAIVHHRGQSRRLPAYLVEVADPTGAGDVFAAAYLIRYHETGDAIEAARFANCVASFVIEGVGTENIPDRERVEDRLRRGRLRD
ncbi:MAG: ribokinase [Chloroflexi bacterium]|nr:ribokinase [Chloroflexota bacterium]